MTPQGTPGAGTGAGTEKTADQQVDVAALQKKVEELSTQVEEHKQATQYWHEKATAKPEPPKAEPEEPEVDVLDLATKGGKAFEKYLEGWAHKNGFVSSKEVEEVVNTRAGLMAKEQELEKRYPDLTNRETDFFKETAKAYGELKKANISDGLAMEMAAERTELAFLRSGKMKTTQQQTEDKKAEKERDRLARIAAQGGEGGRRPAEPEEDDEDITPGEEKIIRGMLVGQLGEDGKPMTYDQAVEKFKARAKAGVRVSRRSR